MKNVIVYRCGKVVADGVELSHVRAVDPPFSDVEGSAFGSVTFDITGELTFSPFTYAKAPAPVVTNTTRVRKVKERIADLRNSGALRSDTYAEILNALV